MPAWALNAGCDPDMPPDHLRRIRACILIFMAGLILSGITALPLETEINWVVSILRSRPLRPIGNWVGLLPWMELVNRGISETNARYPFVAYGTDWLAFAHFVIAAAFIGPYRDPVRNKWVITFGLIACVSVIPLALIAGSVRHIPFWWRLIDCSFGILGALPLIVCKRLIELDERLTTTKASTGVLH